MNFDGALQALDRRRSELAVSAAEKMNASGMGVSVGTLGWSGRSDCRKSCWTFYLIVRRRRSRLWTSLVAMACSGAADSSRIQGANSQARRAAKTARFRRLRWCAASVFDLICTSESGEGLRGTGEDRRAMAVNNVCQRGMDLVGVRRQQLWLEAVVSPLDRDYAATSDWLVQ